MDLWQATLVLRGSFLHRVMILPVCGSRPKNAPLLGCSRPDQAGA